MRAAFVILALAFLCTLALGRRDSFGQGILRRQKNPAGEVERSLTVSGVRRTYFLHVPSKTNPGRIPLLLVFHGGSQTAADASKVTGYDAVSDREGFVVAYPQGFNKSWNDGRGTTDAERKGVDDVGFVRALIEDVRKLESIDPARVYATGMSNGGFFTQRLGCEMSEVFAAIGPVIASMPSALSERCHPDRPISVIAIQGTADPLVPINGGEVGGDKHLGAGGEIEPADTTYHDWAERNGCSTNPASTKLPVRESDGTSVEELRYTGCSNRTEVVFYKVSGMGHRWPAPQQPPPRPLIDRVLGPFSTNLDATEKIWSFFASHARKAS